MGFVTFFVKSPCKVEESKFEMSKINWTFLLNSREPFKLGPLLSISLTAALTVERSCVQDLKARLLPSHVTLRDCEGFFSQRSFVHSKSCTFKKKLLLVFHLDNAFYERSHSNNCCVSQYLYRFWYLLTLGNASEILSLTWIDLQEVKLTKIIKEEKLVIPGIKL